MDTLIKSIQEYIDAPTAYSKRNLIVEYSIDMGKDVFDSYIFISMMESRQTKSGINYIDDIVGRIMIKYRKDSRIIFITDKGRIIIVKNK